MVSVSKEVTSRENVNKYVIEEFREPQIYNQDSLAQEWQGWQAILIWYKILWWVLFYMFGETLCKNRKVLSFGKVLLSLVNYYSLGQFETLPITQFPLESIKFNSMVGPSHQYS